MTIPYLFISYLSYVVSGFERANPLNEYILRGITDLSLRWLECDLHRLDRFSLDPDNKVNTLY